MKKIMLAFLFVCVFTSMANAHPRFYRDCGPRYVYRAYQPCSPPIYYYRYTPRYTSYEVRYESWRTCYPRRIGSEHNVDERNTGRRYYYFRGR